MHTPHTSVLLKPWEPMGEALLDYCNGNVNATLYIRSTIEGDRAVPAETFFRKHVYFPPLEKSAVKLCTGKILDAGAGAGPHALFMLEDGKDVTAMDISDKSAEVMRARGLPKVYCADLFTFDAERFDTILLLMNGIGIAGDLEGLGRLLQHLKTLLNPGGKIIFESTDIGYVTEYERAASTLRLPPPSYYGIVHYQLEYKGRSGEIYPWLFIDALNMKRIALENGYQFRILKSKRSQYLAQLTVKP